MRPVGALDPQEHQRQLHPPVHGRAALHNGVGAPVRREPSLREDDDGIAPADRPQDAERRGHVGREELFRQDAAPFRHDLEDGTRAVVFIDKVTGLARVRHPGDVIEVLKGLVIRQQDVRRIERAQRRVVDLDALPSAQPQPDDQKNDGVHHRIRRPLPSPEEDTTDQDKDQREQQRGQREDRRQLLPQRQSADQREHDLAQKDGEQKQSCCQDRDRGDPLSPEGVRRRFRMVHGVSSSDRIGLRRRVETPRPREPAFFRILRNSGQLYQKEAYYTSVCGPGRRRKRKTPRARCPRRLKADGARPARSGEKPAPAQGSGSDEKRSRPARAPVIDDGRQRSFPLFLICVLPSAP